MPPLVSISPDKKEYAYNETVTFGCPIGYTLNGEKVKDCLHSADLTENLPSCTGISKKLVCHLYLQRALIYFVTDGLYFRNTFKFKCKPVNEKVLTCILNSIVMH